MHMHVMHVKVISLFFFVACTDLIFVFLYARHMIYIFPALIASRDRDRCKFHYVLYGMDANASDRERALLIYMRMQIFLLLPTAAHAAAARGCLGKPCCQWKGNIIQNKKNECASHGLRGRSTVF